jgi:4-aminobutyrate aminotransferase-like enzyme
MLGIHLWSEQRVKEVIAICHENGVLIDWFLFNAKTLRLAPPLIIGNGEINKVCKIILKALDEAS